VIVFSATNEVTGDVFVGNTREGLEVEWAQLISQADEGASGKFFALIRRHGADSFEVEEYAYADSGAELRELTREARDELGAEAIKSARRSSGSVIGKKSMSMEAIMASIEEAAREAEAGMAPATQQDSVPAKSSVTQAKTPEASKPAVAAPSSSAAEPKIAAGRSGSASKEKRIREAIAAEREARDQLRQTQSRNSQAEMNAVIARIEQRREANKASGKKSTTKKSTVKKSAATKSTATKSSAAGASKANTATAAQTPSKLAAGRTGSSAKEKRIKEAIALEKAEREAQQKAKAAAEADEMAAILARLDARTKSAEKIKRRR
jgi:colicin import membrane protein